MNKQNDNKEKSLLDEQHCCSVFDRGRQVFHRTLKGNIYETGKECYSKYSEINPIDEPGDGLQLSKADEPCDTFHLKNKQSCNKNIK